MEHNHSRMEFNLSKNKELVKYLDAKYILYIYDNFDPLWLEGYHQAIQDVLCALENIHKTSVTTTFN